MRLFFLLLLTIVQLLGRDNPFFSADPNSKQTPTTNRAQILKPFSSQQLSVPSSARAIKAVIIRYQNLDGSISDEQLELNNAIDWHLPFTVSQNNIPVKEKKPSKIEKRDSVKFIDFLVTDKTLKLITTDKMLRNFMLTSPYRIVVDFERDTSFKPKEFVLDEPPFSNIRMGNHDKFYRVVIELDGQYQYTLNSSETDHTIVCK